jgi:putative transposase
MKKSKFSEYQIIQILKQGEAGLKVAALCREHGISPATYDKWKAKYGGMEVAEVKRLQELEAENRRLKQMDAELSLDYQILKEVLEKKH